MCVRGDRVHKAVLQPAVQLPALKESALQHRGGIDLTADAVLFLQAGQRTAAGKASGKTITVSCYEKRYNYHGEAYYARFNGIQSKQRKRVLDWAEGMPMDIRKSVWSFFGEGGRQYGKVAEL